MAQQSSRPLGSMLDLKQWHCTEFLSLLRPPRPTWITHLAKPSEPVSQLALCSSLRWGHSHSRISMLATPRLEQPPYAPHSRQSMRAHSIHCVHSQVCRTAFTWPLYWSEPLPVQPPAHCVVPHRSTEFAVVSQQLHTFHKATSSCPWKCSLRILTWF